MSTLSLSSSVCTLFVAVIAASALISHSGPVFAGDPTSEEIICKLDPHCPFSKPGFRRLEITGDIPDDPLTVNLYVNFPYNSAELGSDARITLDKLGRALADPRLSSFSFSIVGHTDAKGSDEFNQKLSERRAATVQRYLIQTYGITSSRLASKGMGRSELLDPSRPDDGINRRVQILNVTALKRD